MSLLLLLRGGASSPSRTVSDTLGAVSEAVTVATVFSHTETYYEDPVGGVNKTLTVPVATWQAGDLVLVNVTAQGSVDYDFRVSSVVATGLTFTQASLSFGHPTSELWQARAASSGAVSIQVNTARRADAYAVTVLAVRHVTSPVYLDTASITYNDGFDNFPTVSLTPTDAVGRLFTIFSVVTEASLVLDPGTAAPNVIRSNDASGALVTSSSFGDHITAGLKTTDAALTNPAEWTALSFFVSKVQHLSLTANELVAPITELPASVGLRTRFYLPSTGNAAVNPAFSTWTETTNANRLRTVVLRSGTAMVSKAQSHVATAANSTFLSRMYVSDPIRAQTIPVGTVKGTIRVLESAVNDNLDAVRLTIRVVNNAGTTFRSPNLYGPVNGTVAEFNTAFRAKRLAIGGATASVTALAGDRIVIEIGTTNTTVGASLSDTIAYGDDAATDLGDNETDVNPNNPFVELSYPLTFSQNPVRSAGATIATLSDLAGKVASHLRTVPQTVGAFTSGIVNGIVAPLPPTFSRNAGSGDSLASIVEGVTRNAGYHFTSSATVATLTEAAGQVKALPRTVAATIATLTESVSAGGFHYIRTAIASLVGFIYGDTPWGASTYGSGTGIAELATRIVTSGAARVVADSVATMTESVSRASASLGRTVAQTLGSITEAVARLVTEARTSSDTVATISEVVARLVTEARTVADSIATLTETVARAAIAKVRTVADSLGSISELVTIGAAAIVRSVAESLATLTESVSRAAAAKVRTTADTIASLTESVSRAAVAFARTVAESIGGISEAIASVFSGIAHLVRSAADTVESLAEAITGQLKIANRTVAQSLGSVSETVARGVAAFVRITQDTVGVISETVTKNPGAAFVRSVGASIGSIVETVANGAQVVGGPGPAVAAGLHSLARALGYSPTPSGSGTNSKPRK